MTKEQKVRAFEMRMEGYTFQEIADEFGTTKQNIQKTLDYTIRGQKRPIDSIIYPNLRDYLRTDKMNVLHLSRKMGYESNNASTLYKKLRGNSLLTMGDIRKILEITKMSFEECFYLEDAALEKQRRNKKSAKSGNSEGTHENNHF